MKSLRIAFCALCALFIATATPALAADQLKIATFNVQQVIEKSKAGAEARKALEAKKAELQPKFKGDQDALKAMADEIEKKGSAWSDEVKAGKERDYQKRLREYQLKVEDAQFEMKQLERKVLDPLFKELQTIINDIGKTEGISLIFEKSRSNGLLYAADSLDISDQVIKALDAKLPTLNVNTATTPKAKK
ncbi:MAG: OmpH family outer membrane protein [Desulfobacteraceae bacterium]|nr:OmpH family outer membrane protein [Desulfobacteraceae bacterium]